MRRLRTPAPAEGLRSPPLSMDSFDPMLPPAPPRLIPLTTTHLCGHDGRKLRFLLVQVEGG